MPSLIRDFELIVVDDASTDGTPEVLTRFEGRCRPARMEVSKGANGARNLGLSLAHGELVAFLDDDDRWLPRKLEAQVTIFDRLSGIALVGCRFRKDGEIGEIPVEVSRGALLGRNLVGGFSMCMFPRSLVREIGGLDETLGSSQDWDTWLKLSLRGRVLCVPTCLVEYATGSDDCISACRDRRAYYGHYREVVRRNEDDMSLWVRALHTLVLGYHTTKPGHPFRKLGMGILTAYSGLLTASGRGPAWPGKQAVGLLSLCSCSRSPEKLMIGGILACLGSSPPSSCPPVGSRCPGPRASCSR